MTTSELDGVLTLHFHEDGLSITKAKLGKFIAGEILKMNMKNAKVAKQLEVTVNDIREMLLGHFDIYTLDELINMIIRLGYNISIKVE